MKIKNIILLLVLLSAELCLAQTIERNTDFGYNKKVKKAHYINQYNEHIYRSFDKKGRLTKIYHNDHASSHMSVAYDTLYRTVEYIYKKDKLIKRLNFYMDTLQSCTEFIYNNGKLVLELQDGVATTQYCYSDNRLALRQFFFDTSIHREEITYNDNLSLTETQHLLDDKMQKVVKEYFNKHYYIKETYLPYFQDYIRFEDRWAYHYDNNKNLVMETFYRYNGENTTVEYTYKNNLLFNSKSYDKEEFSSEQFYDSKGNVILEKRYDGHDDTIYKNVYNNKGDLILVEWLQFGKSRKKTIEYEYWD